MANRYANLVGSNKIKDEWQKINTGFDLVQQDVDQLQADLSQEIADREAAVEYVDQRVDNIIVGGGPDKDPELVDIRTVDPSYTPQREINVAGDVTRDMQEQFAENTAYYLEVTISKHRDDVSGTDYYLTRIPHKDSKGNVIPIKRGFANDSPMSGSVELARHFAARKNATVVINASPFNVSTHISLGTQIYQGTVLKEEVVPSRYIMGIKEDNTLVWYPPDTPASTIIADGCINALTGFIPIIDNGVQVDQSIIDEYTASGYPHPRQVMAQYPNKDILIFSCDGRLPDNQGMTIYDVIRILLAEGVRFAFNLDGGGSVHTVYRGRLINRPSDNNGYSERAVPDFLYFGKDGLTNRDRDLTVSSAEIGELDRKVTNTILDVYNKNEINSGYARLKAPEGYKTQGIEVWEGEERKTKLNLRENTINYWDYVNNRFIFSVDENGDLLTRKGTFGTFLNGVKIVNELDSIAESGIYWIIPTSDPSSPDGSMSWAVLHIQHSANNAIQVAYSFRTPSTTRVRRKSSGSWEAWG